MHDFSKFQNYAWVEVPFMVKFKHIDFDGTEQNNLVQFWISCYDL